MTPQEINAWARIKNLTDQCHGKKVAIKSPELNRYMGTSGLWVADIREAAVLNYTDDKVGDQLMQVELSYGAKWEAEVVR